MSEISGNKQRLLIVDDSKVIRVTARKILQNYFETVEAVDGNNAWDILTSQEPFSLIISDLTMPNLDGFGLLDKVRNSHLPHVRNIPVIIITGANDSEATMQRATKAGATDFIGKPFDSVHLLARTQAHANSYTVNAALTEENISLEDRSLVDPTTGLANDKAFLEQGRAQLSYAIRHGTTLALVCLEIDDFGDLARAYDPEITELAVKSVSAALAENIRKEDLAARIGTARFALLLPGMTANAISRLTDRIKADISSQIRFTVSIGTAAPELRPDTEFDDLLNAANASLKQAIAEHSDWQMPDEPQPGVPAQDVTVGFNEWDLEPIESTDTASGAKETEASPQIEELLIETLDSQPEAQSEMEEELLFETLKPQLEPDTEPDVEFEAITLEDEIALDTGMESVVATTHVELARDADTAVEEVEESIVITSPYSLYDLEEIELADPEETADTETETLRAPAPEQRPVPAAAPVTLKKPVQSTATADTGGMEDIAEHPGAFRRLLRALFGRRE